LLFFEGWALQFHVVFGVTLNENTEVSLNNLQDIFSKKK